MLSLFDWIHWIIIFGVPLLLLASRNFPSRPRSLFGKLVLTILIVWILSMIHRYFTFPYRLRAARESGNLLYDGTAANAFTLFAGWTFGIIGSIPALIIRLFVSLFSPRKTKAIDDHPPIVHDPSNPYSPPASPPQNPSDN